MFVIVHAVYVVRAQKQTSKEDSEKKTKKQRKKTKSMQANHSIWDPCTDSYAVFFQADFPFASVLCISFVIILLFSLATELSNDGYHSINAIFHSDCKAYNWFPIFLSLLSPSLFLIDDCLVQNSIELLQKKIFFVWMNRTKSFDIHLWIFQYKCQYLYDQSS